MIQPALQQDTLLKQLHQAVEFKSSQSLDISRKLIEPMDVRFVDSVSQRDTLQDARNKAAAAYLNKNQLSRRQNNEILTQPPVVAIQPDEIVLYTAAPGRNELVLPEKKIDRGTPDWVVGIFLLTLVLFATVRLFFNKYLVQLIDSTINYSSSSRLFRERSLSLTHASFRLDVIFYLVFSLFLFQAVEVFRVSIEINSVVLYLLIFSGVVLYFLLKRLVYLFQGNISGGLPDTQEFLFNMSVYNRILGLVLLPISLVVAFTPLPDPQWAILPGLVAICFFYILLIFRGIRILMRKHFSIFYLILYLCALEILPLLFIYKLVLV
ncbi:DUF4271 domain-containing protein [Prolixibacteraceae bacterium A06]|uniref:DUF4271 domain-containing protein n=2 Tax=Gaoshiqia sediminis TaxID=2986998 RepID=A0AA41YBX7_9BACT|nr:DUF4271 domain-containing protein [Gaoshiqia sediminis]